MNNLNDIFFAPAANQDLTYDQVLEDVQRYFAENHASTIAEAGVKGYDMGYWFAAYAPANTPAPVVAKLNQLLNSAVSSAAAKSFFDMSGSEPWTTTPQELSQFQAAETQKWGKVIKAAGITPE